MESKLRTIAKAITWQALGLAVTGALAWFHTGNMVTALHRGQRARVFRAA